jgi:predicted MFS family arabinose efflux permease
MPSAPSDQTETPSSPFAFFSILRTDLLFVYMLTVWFIFGIANLAMMPQRFEYLTQARYGYLYSPMTVTLLVTIIPETTRIVLLIPMGRLFDHVNFISLRIFLNLLFLLFQVSFFHAHSFGMLVVGAIMLGAADAGGAVAWGLWVTKYSKPAATKQYMSLHTFFTGVRGMIGPYAGYLIADQHSIHRASWISAGLISFAIVLLVPLFFNRERFGNDATTCSDPMEG